MSELRWILLGLGAILIAGVYFFSRKPLRRLPERGGSAESEPADSSSREAESRETAIDAPRPRRRASPEKVVTLRVVCRHESDMKAQDAVLALKRVGLTHGKYGIFHRLDDAGADEPLFSVASLTEPGSFDLENLQGVDIAGLSLFMVLPGSGDPVARFDLMIQLGRDLAEDLDGILLDERGSSWSIQRERYIREEIIQFHHQLNRA